MLPFVRIGIRNPQANVRVWEEMTRFISRKQGLLMDKAVAQSIERRTGMREAWVRIPEAEREGNGDGLKRRGMDVDSPWFWSSNNGLRQILFFF